MMQTLPPSSLTSALQPDHPRHDRRRSDEWFRVLVNLMQEGVAVMDGDGEIVYVNPSFCKITGRSHQELIGSRFTDLLARPDIQLTQEWFKGVKDVPFEVNLATRQPVVACVSLRPLLDAERRFTGSFAVVTDISKRRQAENALHESIAQLQRLSEQLIHTQEQERKRIASELHDSLGQYLYAIKLCLEQQSDTEPGGSASLLTKLIAMVQEAIDELRRISADLHPPMIDDLGILPTIHWFCRRFEGIYPKLKIDRTIKAEEHKIPERLKITLFRVLQEALNNVAKHAGASRVFVRLTQNTDRIELEVEDHGVGFEVAGAPAMDAAHQGFGLTSMRERVRLSGGDFAVESFPGKGTRISACWGCHKT